MVFTVLERHQDEDHQWAVLSCACDPTDDSDALVVSTVTSVRDAYGEAELRALAEPDPLVARAFDLEAVLAAFRQGLPDPSVENTKPRQLRNYRSETAEVVARQALAATFGVAFPASPQLGKTNPNQPVLGFDGWGVSSNKEGASALVLVLVKSTDDAARPPGEAHTLAQEFRAVPTKRDALCRALSVLAVVLDDTSVRTIVLGMLESLGQDVVPPLVVAPVIVRGTLSSHIDDLKPVRAARSEIAPAIALGLTVSIGTSLDAFGEAVMTKARAA
jgi:hypothetical protein